MDTAAVKPEKIAMRAAETQRRIQCCPVALLAVDAPCETTLLRLRPGARTSAVLVTHPETSHCFQDTHDRVVIKLYKGTGKTPGSQEYQDYHHKHFHSIGALTGNERIQQSITGGVKDSVGPYAVIQYIEGEELRPRLLRADLTRPQASKIIRDILEHIWIPLWAGKLRFKDCHAGNFVLGPDMRVFMIDTEQMRKDAKELLTSPDNWTQRDKHQDSGLRRLPGLVCTIIEASCLSHGKAACLRLVKSSLKTAGMGDSFVALGRSEGSVDSALQAVDTFIQDLVAKGLVE